MRCQLNLRDFAGAIVPTARFNRRVQQENKSKRYYSCDLHVSCDLHIAEASEIYYGLTERFGDKALNIRIRPTPNRCCHIAADPALPYCDPAFDPFWARAQDYGVPLTMHSVTGQELNGGLPEHWGTPIGNLKGCTLAHTTVVNTMTDLICGGVAERFPGLRFVVAEYVTGCRRLQRQRTACNVLITLRTALFWFGVFDHHRAGHLASSRTSGLCLCSYGNVLPVTTR